MGRLEKTFSKLGSLLWALILGLFLCAAVATAEQQTQINNADVVVVTPVNQPENAPITPKATDDKVAADDEKKAPENDEKKIDNSLALKLLYGQDERFWKTVDRLKNSPDTAALVNEVFSDDEKQVQEAVASASIHLSSSEWVPYKESFRSASFAFGMEGVAGGQMRNRISPEIDAYEVYHGFLRVGVEHGAWEAGNLFSERYYEDGFGLALASRVGLGRQQLLRGEASAFLNNTEEDKHIVYEAGLNAGLSYKFWFNQRLRSLTEIGIEPRFFHSNNVKSSYRDAVEPTTGVYRWRINTENIYHFSEKGGLGIGGQAFFGPQPFPVDFLPVVWDAVHKKLIRFDHGAQFLGIGPVVELASASRRFGFRAFGGFYGGYWGTGAELKLSFFQLSGGSFGLEMSRRYRTTENRINFLQGGIGFAW